MTEIKETIDYKYTTTRRVVLQTKWKTYPIFIIWMGTHPCAYVELPKDHPYTNKSISELDLYPHYDITYKEKELYLNEGDTPITSNACFIGWDYAHLTDFIALPKDVISRSGAKKWTVVEILKHCTDAIDHLIEAEGLVHVNPGEIIALQGGIYSKRIKAIAIDTEDHFKSIVVCPYCGNAVRFGETMMISGITNCPACHDKCVDEVLNDQKFNYERYKTHDYQPYGIDVKVVKEGGGHKC